MTSRKRKNSSTSSSDLSYRAGRHLARKRSVKRDMRRKHLLETLEARQLLAGPELAGIQPNQGDLIVDGSVRETAPRVLTFRFDEDQQLDPETFEGIQISRAGADGDLGTSDDVAIEPGMVTLGDPDENEVIVRFAETLPDDSYRIDIYGFDDAGQGITGLRNEQGEFFVPSDPDARVESIEFDLRLGALVESVVPQPVVRLDDGSLAQNRNEIVVYFNEDPLFVEDDADGNPTERSAENPRFYQLLLTQDTVRTTDDALYHPAEVVYDAETHTARLFFRDDAGQDIDINDLGPDEDGFSGVQPGGGTFRLRIGTAVDDRVDLIVDPAPVAITPSATIDMGDGTVVLESRDAGEAASGRQVRFEDTGSGGLSAQLETDGTVVFDFGGASPTLGDLQSAVAANASVNSVIRVRLNSVGTARSLPQRLVGAPPLTLAAVGDSLQSAFDVTAFHPDAFGNDGLTSLVFNESIDAQPFLVELPGGNDDPGHRELAEVAGASLIQHINERFGADTTDGVTEIAYNFRGIFDTDTSGNSFLNQITERQKRRIREALALWSNKIGVQFRETRDEGITFALGNPDNLQPRGGNSPIEMGALDAHLRIDPTFNQPAMVFSNQVDFGTAYGEDFLRKATAGIGFLLGLESTPDLPAQTLMALSNEFLNASIDQLQDLEPVFPGRFDQLHGQYLHRPDSIDVDLYRFQVSLDDAEKTGTLTAETFAERLADSSLLDTTLTLFEEVRASATTDFGVGTELSVRFDAIAPGREGNNARIDFIRSDRLTGDDTIRITQPLDESGEPIANAIVVDMPRRGPQIDSVPVGDLVEAINEHPVASSIFRASITTGDASIDISSESLSYSPVLLSGGGLHQLSRNDDYFSEDSRLIADLDAGTYYVGVAASGNDHYDPTIPGSGYGGRTQGEYELHLKFEPQVDKTDVIRDLDSERTGVPGTPLDGDGDGAPGGVHNFWFQTRPLQRTLDFTGDGRAVTAGQEITVVGAGGSTRTYEFVPGGDSARPGNIAVAYSPGDTATPSPAGNLAQALVQAINSRQGVTGVSVTRDGTRLTFTGERQIEFSDDFRGAEATGRTIFVDKTAGPRADGSLDRPFNNIANPAVANAFDAALDGDIVRIVGNGGQDQNLATEEDNFSYQIGVAETGGGTLEDGRTMEVPQGVTTMIDAGAAFKMRGARIGVGSSTFQVDRSGGALQVLGTPRLVDLSDPQGAELIGGEDLATGEGFDDGSVIFTSFRDRQADADAAVGTQTPRSGDWGGLVFRRDIDQAQGRRDLEDQGIFLQHVNHAELRYGGSSNLRIDSVQQLVNPIQIINLRPTITFNEISQSNDAAISAAPDSFEESSFQGPQYQQAGSFTADYDRVGPDMHRNRLVDNSINGVFVRVTTTPSDAPRELTVAGRFDDIDIVHYIAENVTVAGNPGGSIDDGFAPSMSLVSGRQLSGGTLDAGTYRYKMTFVDDDGFESAPSGDAFSIDVGEDASSVEVTGLPLVGSNSDYVSRRIYRAVVGPGGNASSYRLVAELDARSNSYIDDGSSTEGVLDLGREGVRGRLDGSLVMDPGLVVKLRGARIELGMGTQLLAEGLPSDPVVFTSALDDRYGAGGTFDTNNDNDTASGAADPVRGDWAGLYASPNARISLDQTVVAYGGGISLIQGGESRGFAPVELQQADGRITNTRFEFNDDGQDGAGPVGRFGRLGVTPSTIFVRGAQPTIVGNTFVDNRGTTVDIDSESMTAERIIDAGRQTGAVDRFAELDDNHGPLIRYNRYENVPADADSEKQITGLEIRGGTLTTASVWDDTDIVHLLFDSIEVGNFHSSGGLRLMSRPDESLVVKLDGSGTPNSPTIGTGLTATGSTSNVEDRIGGTVQVIGMPGAPVVMTSFKDDTVGAGLKPDGSEFTDSNGDSFGSRPEPNDWRSILLDQYSNDRNVDFIPEQELSTEVAPGPNAEPSNAQYLGELASDISASDEHRRLGFEVEGFLSTPRDIDTYSFTGTPGTEIWVDVDQTSFTVDTVIELLDEDGNVLARSDNSYEETSGGADVAVFDSELADASTTSLQARAEEYTERGAGGLYKDLGSVNPRDAGIHFTLPGNSGETRGVYFFRVRSASVNPDDASGGLTSGGYGFQVRLTEDQEFPGSIVRYSDIRFANHGVHLRGLPGSSPLLGEAQENESVNSFYGDNDEIGPPPGTFSDTTPLGWRPQYLGNLADTKGGVISVAGELGFGGDVDFYQMEIDYSIPGSESLVHSTIFDIDYADGFSRPNTNLSVFFDPDGEFGIQPPRLVLLGQDSNILDDQTSPLGENSGLEKLARGSVAPGDAFIGPVSLPEGTYYVAVTGEGVEPSELNDNPLLRREPVNSVERIVEDRINPATPSTAGGPRIDDFFTDAAIAGSGFTHVVETSPGHGKPTHFDGTSGPDVTGTGVYQERLEFDDAGTLPTTAADLDSLDWSLADSPQIGGEFQTGGAPNTSTSIPHVTIEAALSGDLSDFYQVTVDEDNSRVIIDVDEGVNPFIGVDDDDPLTPPFRPDPRSVDTDLVLLEANPNNAGMRYVPLSGGRITTSSVLDGRGGSSDSADPFLDMTLDAGTYFIGVLPSNTNFSIDDNGAVSVDSDDLPDPSSTYVMHVSVEDHAVPPGTVANTTLHYNRTANTAPGTLTSAPFDLGGYTAADLPTLYFNYNYQPDAGDNVSVRVFSNEDPGGTVLSTPLDGDGTWRQLRADLGQFAGDSGVQVEFVYTPGSSSPGTNDGLYLDDFIVGFAERGETIFAARGGEDGFTGGGSGVDGEYQLEMRAGTEYGRAVGNGGQTLVADFDTNARHSQRVTIVAPAGDQIADGDTFIIGDGTTNQTFEFTTTAGSVSFGNTPVLFSTTDTPADVAESIRTAINQQTRIEIEASSASGLDTQMLTDGRIALSGEGAVGSFLSIDSAADAPGSGTPLPTDAEGNLLLPAVLHNGKGDFNVQRAQGQVIIDSNTISDARAIGIWSEPGDRDVDPEDVRQDPNSFFGGSFGLFDPFRDDYTVTDPNPFLQQPPVGNPHPGAVRNLPTLNDSVIGGLAPGVVITNNTIDQAGYSGVKVDGETRPWMIEVSSGNAISDGTTMAIDAAGTRVVFEFEDISGAPEDEGGSGTVGGDGFVDGHVPIYYRRSSNTTYNPNNPDPDRNYAYSSTEMATAIMQSIQGSILMTNGMVELVTPTIGPSLKNQDQFAEALAGEPMGFPNTAVYLQGASQIYTSVAWSETPRQAGIDIDLAPVAEAPQPFARLVNNTIYGADGTESAFPESGDQESNDVIDTAVDTKVGRSHRGPYVTTAQIGDNADSVVDPEGDVDFYRVELGVGDRLIVDVDPGTDPEAGVVDTAVRIFDSQGNAVSFQDTAGNTVTVSDQDTAPDYLDPASTVATPVADDANGLDPFVDFTARATGTYYVAVSSAGNDDYDPTSLSGRDSATGGTGEYTISIENYAPRSFVMSLDNENRARNTGADRQGSRADQLIGTTFTITQIPDLDPALAQADGTNQVTFEFTAGGGPRVLGNGNVSVPLLTGTAYVVPDIMRAISNAINGYVNDPTLPNHEDGNGPDGRSGPITRGRAFALGGLDGDNAGIANLTRLGLQQGEVMWHYLIPSSTDFQRGFGHDRTGQVGSVGIGGTTTDGIGTTELYTLVENVADIEISPEAAAAGLRLDPEPDRDTDQLINETGVMIAGGASPALLNNVFMNLHESVVVEETNSLGFGSRNNDNDQHVKPMEVVVVGSTFQYDETNQTRFNSNIDFISAQPGTGLTTDEGPSNLNGGTDDFNLTLGAGEASLANPAGNNFLPDQSSVLVDSAINSLVERDAFVNLKNSVGIPASNIIAPDRDVNGVLRADNPDVAPPGGVGGSVFKDRGSVELADFVGPVAIAEVPRDNDAQGQDEDPAVSYIQLTGGTYEEFRIQLRDNGDASDPFSGIGVDDSTVVVPEIPGLRPSGAAFTLFENGRLLEEGVDYTFHYDETKNIVTLTPLAGVWQGDRSYRIAMNNRDRNVVVAPDPSEVADGDQLSITDSNGRTVFFEFETGYQMRMPDPLTLIVPEVGTNAGGLSDGDIFQIDDGAGGSVTFEFDSDSATLGGTVPVTLPTPEEDEEPAAFLNRIAKSIEQAVQSAVDSGQLDVDPRVIGDRVVIGAEPAASVETTSSGLLQSARTLALEIPEEAADAGGIADGDQFVVDDGNQSITFEFDTDDATAAGVVPVPVTTGMGVAEIADEIVLAIEGSDLSLRPEIIDERVYLNLPADGAASVPGGQLSVVGVSRTPLDGETFTVTPVGGGAEVTFEINRTDEAIPDGVEPGNVAVDVTRTTTAEELAERIVERLHENAVAGLDATVIEAVEGGIVSIGGEEGLGLTTTSSVLEVLGEPSVTGSSTIQIADTLADGETVTITQEQATVTFEFEAIDGGGGVAEGNIAVPFQTGSTPEEIAMSLASTINNNLGGLELGEPGATASAELDEEGNLVGVVTLDDRPGTSLDVADSESLTLGGVPGGAVPIQISPDYSSTQVKQAIVMAINTIPSSSTVEVSEAPARGDSLSITHAGTTFTFEFDVVGDAMGVASGNLAVPIEAGSTVGEIAASLASVIEGNLGDGNLSAEPELDSAGNPTGRVLLSHPQDAELDASAAPSLTLSTDPPVTNLVATDRGGATLFVENGQLFSGPVENFYLPAIKDQVGNPLEPNRDDLTTQFTILMPTVGLDFGDAPDPADGVAGRYPTQFENNGARHVVGPELSLGSRVDADVDGQPTRAADGDDLTIDVSETGTLFEVTVDGGNVEIEVQDDFEPSNRDGDTITIDTGVAQATFELDFDGVFDEDNFAIQPGENATAEMVAAAIATAFAESPLPLGMLEWRERQTTEPNDPPLLPAQVQVDGRTVSVTGDDEDGVSFVSSENPTGALNKAYSTPVSVTVTGAGVLEAWIDFNADGDWDDPGEQIISAATPGAIFSDADGPPVTRVFEINVPETAPTPSEAVETYARFRVSPDGGLSPTGLALGGEVEDYQLVILPGQPPELTPEQTELSYRIRRGSGEFLADDVDGTDTATTNDNGILVGVVDPDGDPVAIASEDTGERQLRTTSGRLAGELTLFSDGTFHFDPDPDFSGDVQFTAHVTDVDPLNPESQLVNPTPITVTLSVVRPQYQNPLPGLRHDVSGDGFVTAIDALRVINVLNLRLGSGESRFPVSDLAAPPPDYVDVNGDDFVSALDVLQVINELNRRAAGEGEQLASTSPAAALAATTSYASGGTANLPVRNLEPVTAPREDTAPREVTERAARDAVLTAGFEIADRTTAEPDDFAADFDPHGEASQPESVDAALSLLVDEISLE